MRPLFGMFWLGLLIASASPVFALSPLVDEAWVKQNKDNSQVVWLDIQESPQYQRFHLPGAVNVPYSRWRSDGKNGGVGSSMPSLPALEKMIGAAGIDNDTTVVVVTTGRSAGDLAAAARVYWTFKVLGHEQVAILDGGLVAYANRNRRRGDLETGSNKPVAKTFKANLDKRLLATTESVKQALDNGDQMIDARSAGEFMGLYTGGNQERPGTIPGSMNLPYDWVTENGSASLRPVPALKQLYAATGVNGAGKQVHFCHTGNRAALTWFVSYAIFGNTDARLYDASMMDWARRQELPIEQKIKLCEAC